MQAHRARPALDTSLDTLLGPDGLLARRLPGFERREGQEAMTRAVAGVVRDRGVLLVEAGTGTGKSLAYLLPAALAGEPVIVSTGTRALQDQLFTKDIPFVRDVLGLPFEAALLKGRTNYLCLHGLTEARRNPDVMRPHVAWLERLLAWSRVTETGDRAELADLPDEDPVWRLVSTGAEGCLGQRCEHFDACFVMKARRRAAAADVVVVNHHLYFADLSLRDSVDIALLPPADVVVFDEAHRIEDVASGFFGWSVSDARLRDLAFDTRRLMLGHRPDVGGTSTAFQRVLDATEAFFGRLAPLLPRSRVTPDVLPLGLEEAWQTLDAAVGTLGAHARDHAADVQALAHVADRCEAVRAELERLVLASDPAMVFWAERGARATFLRAAPVNVAGLLQDKLLSRVEAVVLTSATLTAGGDFEHIKRRLGLGDECAELTVPSPFDYARQALMYLPDDLPSPQSPAFAQASVERIRELLDLTAGRAFVLFTSTSAMRRAHERLRVEADHPLLVQGEAPKDTLLRRFVDTPGAVLLGTATFWEGIDVVGDALSLVIIDKLPFAPPDDPVTSARIEWMTAQQRSAFMDYQVPQAIIALKQGFGRLIRRGTDRGIVAILDTRLTTARYGRRFVQSLPPATVVRDLDDLAWRWHCGGPALPDDPGGLPDDGGGLPDDGGTKADP